MGQNWENLLLRQKPGFKPIVLLCNLVSECHELKITLVILFHILLVKILPFQADGSLWGRLVILG